ncbi:MAG: hypothetical protein VX663_04530 [Pseudomonadota bacterium]|nr:hypothetical protein [Pseudomonadota bacterium]
MTEHRVDEFPVGTRRILVPLDPAGGSLAALDAMAEVAAVLGAQIEALLIEDEDLMRAAELPCTREISWSGELREPFVGDRLRHELSGYSRRAQRMLEECRVRWQVQSRIRTARGRLIQEVFKAFAAPGYLAVGFYHRSSPAALLTGRRAAGRTAGQQVPGRVERLVVIASGSVDGVAAARLAAGIAGRQHREILLIAPDAPAAAALSGIFRDGDDNETLRVLVQLRDTFDPAVMEPYSGAIPVRLVLVAADQVGVGPERLEAISRSFDAPVLVIRAAGEGGTGGSASRPLDQAGDAG